MCSTMDPSLGRGNRYNSPKLTFQYITNKGLIRYKSLTLSLEMLITVAVWDISEVFTR